MRNFAKVSAVIVATVSLCHATGTEEAKSFEKTNKAIDNKGLSSRAQKRKELLKTYDRNKNQRLDPEEIEAIARHQNLRWDLNNDGRLDQAELKAMKRQTRQMPRQDKASREAALHRAYQDHELTKEAAKQ